MKKYLLTIALVVSLVLSFIIINAFFAVPKKFEDAALGTLTVPYYASDSAGYPVHVSGIKEFDRLREGWERRGKKDVILFLGNSQWHSINQKKEGDETAAGLLFKAYAPSGFDFLSSSVPNANLQEHYLLLNYFLSKLPVKYLVLPVFMDDLREDGIRDFYFASLNTREEFFRINDSSATAHAVNTQIASFSNTGESDMKALDQTVQEKTESYLDGLLSQHSKSWVYRENIRGQLFLSLYRLRNFVFDLNAQTKRKRIITLYKKNLQALTCIMQTCKTRNIRVLLFIPPLRKDVQIPYVEEEYDAFKKKMSRMAEDFDCTFLDLENIVPARYWGMKASTQMGGNKELDFMHFQYEGHRQLFLHLFDPINTMTKQ